MPTMTMFRKAQKLSALVLFAILLQSLPLITLAATVRRNISPPEQSRAMCQAYLQKRGKRGPGHLHGITFDAVSWTCRQCNDIVKGVHASYPANEVVCDVCSSGMVPTAAAEAFAQMNGGSFTARERVSAPSRTAALPVPEAPVHSRRSYHRAPAPTLTELDLNRPGLRTAPAPAPAPTPRGTIVERTQSQLSEMFLFGRDRLLHRIALGVGVVMLSVMSATTGISMADRPIMGTVESAEWTQTVRLERHEPGVFPMSYDSLVAEHGGIVPEVLPASDGNPEARLVEPCEGEGTSCFYESNVWHTEDSAVTRGTDVNTIPASGDWAQFEIPADGRISTQIDYNVVLNFQHDGETYHVVWRPDSVEEFSNLTPGSKIEVELSPLRHVTGVEVMP